jgi:hypothetical protein
LKGETENAKINFTSSIEISQGFPTFPEFQHIELTSMKIKELKRIQSADGSFDLNQDLADLLSIDINDFEALKEYFYKQGFNSFGKTNFLFKNKKFENCFHLALNIRNEIIHLIATGIVLMELLFQVPGWDRKTYLISFDREQIRVRRSNFRFDFKIFIFSRFFIVIYRKLY